MIGVDPYLIARLGEPAYAGGLEVRFDCTQPRCVARRHEKGSDKKLYVNFSKGVFHCMRCAWGGPIDLLYKSVGLARGAVNALAPANLKEAIGFLSEDDRVDQEEVVVDAPQGIYIPSTTPNWGQSEGYYWLWSRLQTVPPDEVVALVNSGMIRLGSGRYWDRVFFCDVYHGSVRYWTARTYLEGFSPKYLNPYNVPRRNVLFNQEQVENQKYDEVMICEGTISSIVSGPDSVATYGRCVTDAQIEILMSLPARHFILASEADPDAKRNTMALAETLTRRNRYVSILDFPPGKDPADFGRSGVQDFRRYAVPHTWETKLKRRLQCL